MKRQLKAIYDNLTQESSSLPLKVEPAHESKGYRRDGYYSRGVNNSFNGGRGRSRAGRGGSQQNMDWKNQSKNLRKQNPQNSYGKIFRCTVCQSIYHYARDFPHSDSNKSQENKVTLLLKNLKNVSYKIFRRNT